MAIVDVKHTQTIEEAFNQVAEGGSGGDGGIVRLTFYDGFNRFDEETTEYYTYIFDGDHPVYVSDVIQYLREGKTIFVITDNNQPENHLNTVQLYLMMFAGYHPRDYLYYSTIMGAFQGEVFAMQFTGVATWYDEEGNAHPLPENEQVFCRTGV